MFTFSLKSNIYLWILGFSVHKLTQNGQSCRLLYSISQSKINKSRGTPSQSIAISSQYISVCFSETGEISRGLPVTADGKHLTVVAGYAILSMLFKHIGCKITNLISLNNLWQTNPREKFHQFSYSCFCINTSQRNNLWDVWKSA